MRISKCNKLYNLLSYHVVHTELQSGWSKVSYTFRWLLPVPAHMDGPHCHVLITCRKRQDRTALYTVIDPLSFYSTTVFAARTVHLNLGCRNKFIFNVSLFSAEGEYSRPDSSGDPGSQSPSFSCTNAHRVLCQPILKGYHQTTHNVEQHALNPTMQLCCPKCADLPYTTGGSPMIPLR